MKVAHFLVLAAVIILVATCSCGRIPYDIVENDLIHPQVNSPDELKQHKTVYLKASENYHAGPLRRALRGHNYREVWDAPVHVPILWLDTVHGGLQIMDVGGGGQSRSLELKDKAGHYFKLRSIGKNPTVNVPKAIIKLGMGQLVADVTSAGHPYGALAAASLSQTVGIASTRPALYYVPRQPILDSLNDDFGNRLFLLEYNCQGENGDWILGDKKITELTDWEAVKEGLLEDTHHRLDQETLVKARLLDLVIGDWDRHLGNWGWATYRQDGTTRYVPVPEDRDMVFFKLEGAIPWMITRSFIQPRYKPYRKKIKYMPRMMANSKALHAVALNRMTAADFQEKAREIQRLLTDEKVEQALRTWPDTIYRLNASEVREKIIAIRNDLPKYAAEFYELMAERIEVAGTHQEEVFKIIPGKNGEIRIQVMTKLENDNTEQHYDRTFYPAETEEVILLGMDGNDRFEIMKGQYGKINISIAGGMGDDQVTAENGAEKASGSITVYDDDSMKLPAGYLQKKFEKSNYYWTQKND